MDHKHAADKHHSYRSSSSSSSSSVAFGPSAMRPTELVPFRKPAAFARAVELENEKTKNELDIDSPFGNLVPAAKIFPNGVWQNIASYAGLHQDIAKQLFPIILPQSIVFNGERSTITTVEKKGSLETFAEDDAQLQALSKCLPAMRAVSGDDFAVEIHEPRGLASSTHFNSATAHIWDLKSGTRLRTIPSGNPIKMYADKTRAENVQQLFPAYFNREGNRVITTSQSHGVGCWDVQTGEEIYRLGADQYCSSIIDVTTNGAKDKFVLHHHPGISVFDISSGMELQRIKSADYNYAWLSVTPACFGDHVETVQTPHNMQPPQTIPIVHQAYSNLAAGNCTLDQTVLLHILAQSQTGWFSGFTSINPQEISDKYKQYGVTVASVWKVLQSFHPDIGKLLVKRYGNKALNEEFQKKCDEQAQKQKQDNQDQAPRTSNQKQNCRFIFARRLPRLPIPPRTPTRWGHGGEEIYDDGGY